MLLQISDVVLVSLIGGLLALDRTAAFQVMISRPIVSGLITGLILGCPVTGAIMGALTELTWINSLPLGGDMPPNESMATIITTAAVILTWPYAGDATREYLAFGFLFGPPWARLAFIVEIHTRRINGTLAHLAVIAADKNQLRRVYYYNLAGLSLAFLTSAGYIFIGLIITIFAMTNIHPLLSVRILKALDYLYFGLPLIGVAAALSSLNIKSNWQMFALVYGLSLSIWGLLVSW
ncbi:MAG: PTS sugar transporter subunit IIC [Deltaproteobacteria bacterium]|nr:PTS sugar transporter subunit IIC [Deltaproteobacteria bacterium]